MRCFGQQNIGTCSLDLDHSSPGSLCGLGSGTWMGVMSDLLESLKSWTHFDIVVVRASQKTGRMVAEGIGYIVDL